MKSTLPSGLTGLFGDLSLGNDWPEPVLVRFPADRQASSSPPSIPAHSPPGPCEVLPFDQEKHLFDMYTRKSIHLNGKILGLEGRIGEMLDPIPGNLDVTETMVQAVQLHHQSLCR